MDTQQELMSLICMADREGANALLDAWAIEHGHERLLKEILEPTLVRVGEDWCSSETLSLAQVYVAAKIAEDVLNKVASARATDVPERRQRGPVVIGNIEEDFHALGRRLVSTFLKAEGWMVHDLGNDVAPARFVDEAVAAGARVIGVSAMVMTSAMNIRRVRDAIDHRGLTGRVQLAVGGAVFLVCPGLAENVGADGTAVNALAAPALFDKLWTRSLESEAGR